jgi:hypothetical protein
MRNPETEATPVESAFAKGFRARKFHRKRLLGAGNLSSTGWTTRNPDEKIVPAREHSRLTNRKRPTPRRAEPLPSPKAHMDGQRMKENKDAL